MNRTFWKEATFTYCMYLGFLPSQLAMWEVEWLIELAWQYIAMTRNNLSIIWISLLLAKEIFCSTGRKTMLPKSCCCHIMSDWNPVLRNVLITKECWSWVVMKQQVKIEILLIYVKVLFFLYIFKKKLCPFSQNRIKNYVYSNIN